MLAEREPDLEVLLERVDVQRLEPARLGVEPRRAGQALQRRPAPEGQRRRDRVRRGRDVAVAQRGARLREQLLEPDRVDARVLQRVPVGRADDRLLSECGAQAGDVMVERVPRSGRELLAPQAVDERVDVDHPAAAGARASPAAPDASSRPRPRASRPREPRTGREAGSRVVRSSRASGACPMSLAGWNAPVKPRASSTAWHPAASRWPHGIAPSARQAWECCSGIGVNLAVPFTSAVAALMDVLVLGHEPPTEQPRRPLRLRRFG